MRCKLKDFCTVINGRAYSQKELLDKGKYRVLRVGNFFSSDRWYFSDLELPAEKYCNKGDLLFAWACSFGPRIWDGEDRTIFHYHIWKLDIDSAVVDKKYLYYLLKISVESMTAGTHGSVMMHITKSDMENFEFDIPTLEVQKKIAAILSALDEKIAINRAINENLEQQAQAIYHERFETVSPDALPSDWRIVTLGEVATISNKSFNPLKNPEIMLEHYSIPAFDEARFPVFELSTSIKSNKFIIDDSCFMISKLNPITKRVWKPYCLTGNAVCSTEFIVYKAMDKSITDFLYSVIDSGSFSDFMCSHVTGSTGSRQRTTPSDTLSYEFILPSEDKLAEFQSLVSPMYAQIRINAIENDKLKRLRDSLLPKLISGEIDASAVQL
jgi:restriction modification system DNA specificity domain protein